MEVVAGLVSGNSKTMSQYACTYMYIHCFFCFFLCPMFSVYFVYYFFVILFY